ncbi:MAG: ATP-dependent helicase/nuclease subunit [Solirubrobacteraceae bacterium]|jgi:ATP-dependent exoDNAse (exonuclease V) beta subunit|nr:ATP-dependent helicase/nuclease subunit [Solirubrobacteraceae bacterium]
MNAQASLFDDAPGDECLDGPGGRRFTPEQSDAIRARRGSRLLSANAGSGKTAVVVERFARAVLEDGMDPRRILAITFTEKAAGELKQRLRERFVELGDRAAARAAEGAFVSTIHGFCARLLRAHPLAAGLDPAFRVLEVAEAARLRADAFDAAFAAFLDDAAQTGPEALELSAAYRPDRLFGLVDAAHSRLRSHGDTEPTLPDPGERPVPPESRDRLRSAHAAAATCLGAAGDGPTVHKARAALERAQAMLAVDALPALADLRAAEFKAGNTTVLKGPECAEYLEALEDYARAVADHLAVPACRRIGELLSTYGHEYAQRKRARSGLDFEDLELMARDLLESDPGVRAAWRDRFALIMVDEFQDVNGRQLAILELLEDHNLLTVGDELQSIYGFRHADVAIFRERRDRLSAAGAAGDLRASFRAREPLLRTLNTAFAPLFGERFTPLVAGRADAAERPAPLVELLVTDQRGWDEADLGDTLPPALPWRQAEARLLAQRVRELVDAGEARPRETAVLVRALTDLAVYERALEDQGLRTYVAGGRGYWSAQQVADLLAYLGALANPRDETRMFGLLASPLAGLSSDGLATLAAVRREQKRHAWWALEEAFVPGGDGSDTLADRLPPADATRMRDFCPWFAAERRDMPRRSLEELLERAIAGRDYDLHALGLRGGARRMANMRKLLRLAREYEAHEGRDVRGFLDSVELRKEVEAAGEAPVEHEDLEAVRLMTIHGAKGLEFDTVFVADMGRPGRGEHPDLHVSGDTRVGLRLLTLEGNGGIKALDYEELQAERDAADAAEEHRVFYVAMTRARERLVVSGAVPNFDNWPAPALTTAPLAWAAPALAPGLQKHLTESNPVWESPSGVVARLNAPGTVGRVLAAGETAPARAPGDSAAPTAQPAAQLVEVTAPRAPAVRTVSYTGLEAYGRCGYRFYLERVLRLSPDRDAPPPAAGAPAEGIDARLRGSLAHLLLERADLSDPAPFAAEDVVSLATELGERVEWPDAAEIAALAGAFAGSTLGRRLAACEHVRREAPFAFPLSLDTGEVIVNGIVDAIGHEGDRALVVDYKSDRLDDGEEDLGARAARDYRTQRLVYALAALRDGAAEVEVAHSFLQRPEAPVSATFKAADMPRLEAELAKLADGIRAERFEVTPEPHRGLCHDCPGRRALCSWDETMTLRDLAAPAVDDPAAGVPDGRPST